MAGRAQDVALVHHAAIDEWLHAVSPVIGFKQEEFAGDHGDEPRDAEGN